MQTRSGATVDVGGPSLQFELRTPILNTACVAVFKYFPIATMTDTL